MAAPATRGRLVNIFIVVFCLLAALQTESRVHRLGTIEKYNAERIAAGLQTWRVWSEQTPPPAAATLQTRPELAPDVYRVLTPALIRLLAAAGNLAQLYSLAWTLAWWGSLLAIFRLARLWLTREGSFMAVLAVCAVTAGAWQVPELSAVLQGLLLTAALWALLSGRTAWLVVLTVLLAANREDALMLPLVAGLLWLFEPRQRRWLTAALLTAAIAILFRVAAMALLGSRPYYCPVLQVGYNLQSLWMLLTTLNVHHPVAEMFTTLLALAVAAAWPARGKPAFFKVGLWASLLYLIAVLLVARFQEGHRWLQLLPLLAPAAVWRLFPVLRVTSAAPEDEQAQDAAGSS